jgi:WXG100 family type VII secretion target
VKVDLDVMATSADKVATAIEEANSILAAMGADVAELFGSWGGPAADAHGDMHERFTDGAALVLGSLAEMQRALLHTRKVYGDQENAQQGDHIAMSNEITP